MSVVDTSGLDAKDEQKVKDFQSQRVYHAQQKAAFEKVWRSLEQARLDRHITMLMGPTGVGKTNLAEAVQLACIRKFKRQSDTRGHVPYLGVRAIPPLHREFRWPGLFTGILEAADEVLVTNPRGKLIRPYRTSDITQRHALEVLRQRAPLTFCIDEAQHMTIAAGEKGVRVNLELVKSLADDSGVPILLAGTDELVNFTQASGQLSRRIRPIEFMPYRPTKEEYPAFLGAVAFFLKHMPLRCSLDPRAEREFFFEGCVGSIGILKEWFECVIVQCLREKRSTATREDFEIERMDFGRLTAIHNDHDRMRAALRTMKGDRDILRARMGLSSLKPKKATAKARPEPGLRTLQRDPVGIDDDEAA